MGMDRPIVGSHTAELITGGHKIRLPDWDALELAESLPDAQRWTIKLSNGTEVDSEKYRAAKPEMKR